MNPRIEIDPSESRRLESLHALRALDSHPDELFDEMVEQTRVLCDMPIALLTLVGSDRLWVKANAGAPTYTSASRDTSFCTHTICGDTLMEVQDCTADPRFVHSPQVAGSLGIRFYAGAPLILDDGTCVGTLCVLDRRPRKLDRSQRTVLTSLARLATKALQMRRDLIGETLAANTAHEHAKAHSAAIHRAMIQDQKEFVALSDRQGRLLYVNHAYARVFDRGADLVGSNLYDTVPSFELDEVKRHIEHVFETGQHQKRDFRSIDAQGNERWICWSDSLQVDIDGRPMLHSVGRDITERKRLEQALADKERFICQITDNLPLQVAYIDSLGIYRFANLPHCRRLGLARDEVIGHSRHDVSSGSTDEIGSRLPSALSGLEQCFKTEVDMGGVRALVEKRLTPDFDDDGVVRGVFVTSIDITARVASERSVRELLAIFDNTPDFIIQTDGTGHVTYMNPAARRALGLGEREAPEGLHQSMFYPPATAAMIEAHVMPAVASRGVWLGEASMRGPRGHDIPVSHMVIAHPDSLGRVDRYSTLMRDISDEVKHKLQQQRQATTLRSVTESIPALVAVVGPDRRYRFANGSFARWAGTSSDAIEGRLMSTVLGKPLYERSLPWIERALAGEHVTFDKEPGGRNPDKHLQISYIPLFIDGRTPDGFVAVVQDVTAQKREENRLKHLSQRDSLTGSLNRAGMELFLQQSMCDPALDVLEIGALYIDVDRFKSINDTHGHAAGDEVLKQFAKRLVGLVRPTDAVVRLGGDEFVVVLTGVRDHKGIRLVADKIVDMARSPITFENQEIAMGASVGYALGVDDNGIAGLLGRADDMLYKAKAHGRGQAWGEHEDDDPLTRPAPLAAAWIQSMLNRTLES